MELYEAIKGRRSIRVFQDKPVSKEQIVKIIEAGYWAPSACNIQGSKYLVVTDQERKQQLIDAGITKLKNTPVAIFVLYDRRTNNLEYADHIQSGAAAVQNMLLAIHSLDLGGVWVNNLPPQDEMRKILGHQWFYIVIGMIRLGHPARPPKLIKRKQELEEHYFYEHLPQSESVNKKDSKISWFARSTLWYIYNLPPVRKSVLAVTRFFPKHWRERVKRLINRKYDDGSEWED